MDNREFLDTELKIATGELNKANEQLRISEHSADYKLFLAERAGFWRGYQSMVENSLARLTDS